MKFLLQHNCISDAQLKKIGDSFNRTQLPKEWIGVIPFSNEITGEFDATETNYIPYGSTRLTRTGQIYNWKGMHYPDTLSYQSAINNRNDMFNQEATILAAKDIVSYFSDVDPTLSYFMRPDKDDKQFTGYIETVDEIVTYFKDAVQVGLEGDYYVDPDKLIIFNKPKPIKTEYRGFIVNHEIIDVSQYRVNDKLVLEHIDQHSEVFKIYEQKVKQWLPDSCVVMDLAQDFDNNFYVLEFNNINTSGLYNHDADLIFKTWFEFENSRG